MRRFTQEDKRSKILLVTGDPDWPTRVKRALPHWLQHRIAVSHDAVPDVGEVLRRITAADAPVIVIGPGYERADAIALAREIGQEQPSVSVILIAESAPGFFQEVVHAGVRDVLDPSVSDAVLRGSLTLALETAGNRRRIWQATGPIS